MPIKKAWDLVEEAKQGIENLRVEELKAEVAANPDALVIDIREIQERVDLGAIPGSKHVARGMLEFWADPASQYYRDFFQADRRTIVYCAGGGRSALAARVLLDMGFTNVAHLEVGFNGWAKAGQEIEDVSKTSKWIRRS